MVVNKPFTRTELKILVHNKMKNEGLTYSEAVKSVGEDIKFVAKVHNTKKKPEKSKFKDEFNKIKDGKATDN